MTSHRPYRPALGNDAALEELEKNKGRLYNPEMVDVLIRLVQENRLEFLK
jgi:putative two-component system response regulator